MQVLLGGWRSLVSLLEMPWKWHGVTKYYQLLEEQDMCVCAHTHMFGRGPREGSSEFWNGPEKMGTIWLQCWAGVGLGGHQCPLGDACTSLGSPFTATFIGSQDLAPVRLQFLLWLLYFHCFLRGLLPPPPVVAQSVNWVWALLWSFCHLRHILKVFTLTDFMHSFFSVQ